MLLIKLTHFDFTESESRTPKATKMEISVSTTSDSQLFRWLVGLKLI